MMYLLVGFVSVTITTGGNMVIALLGHFKKGGKEAPGCKAGENCPEPKPCFFGRGQNQQIAEVHASLRYADEEGTQRPVLSGHWRKQYDEAQTQQTRLLGELVEQSREQTAILRAMSTPPKEAEKGS